MMVKLEDILVKEKLDSLLVYGDTNSTIPGALVASKLHIPVVHVEAGLRSFHKLMPEEQNRILTDHISDVLFFPTETALLNLKNEGITKGVYNVGDFMLDATLHFSNLADKQMDKAKFLKGKSIKSKEFYLATVHRAENTDDDSKIEEILNAFNKLEFPVVFPVVYFKDFLIIRNKKIENSHVIFVFRLNFSINMLNSINF
jgi:UDP-GlcNAc3NAcA epimerase